MVLAPNFIVQPSGSLALSAPTWERILNGRKAFLHVRTAFLDEGERSLRTARRLVAMGDGLLKMRRRLARDASRSSVATDRSPSKRKGLVAAMRRPVLWMKPLLAKRRHPARATSRPAGATMRLLGMRKAFLHVTKRSLVARERSGTTWSRALVKIDIGHVDFSRSAAENDVLETLNL
jgi:hypothetical protein